MSEADRIHERYMRTCLDLARQALAAGDTPVGALVVREGEVIATGIESVRARNDVTAHAEIEAVRAACLRLQTRDLAGCALYTTVEPCVMCAWALRLARVGLVVAGARSQDESTAVNGVVLLTDAAILPDRPAAVLVRDVLAAECLALLGRPRAGR
jgi:tRNA(adenine34) deaminase